MISNNRDEWGLRCNKGHPLVKDERGIWDCPLCKERMEKERKKKTNIYYEKEYGRNQPEY